MGKHLFQWTLIGAVVAGCMLFLKGEVAAQDKPEPDKLIVYKKTADSKGEPVELSLHTFLPEGWKASDERPAIVFYFGGGWSGGSPSQFYPHCRELADLGMVAMAAEYRVKSRNGTTPFECVADGKSAIRYVREHADELGVDPDRVAAGGGSAGGHVAASTGVIDDLDEEGENTDVSSKPVALVLFNPVIDTSEKGYGYSHLLERYKELSPVEHVTKDDPPTIIFHGTGDTTVPYANVELFTERMSKIDRPCELVPYEGQAHGFFNFGRGDGSAYTDTVKRMKAFLKEQKLLD